MFAINIKNLKKKKKNHRAFKKILSLSIFYSKCGHESGKIFKAEESIEILIILGLINNIEEYHHV